MTGLEVVEAPKAEPDVSNIPVVFVSPRDDFEDKAKEFGALGFLKNLARGLLLANDR